MNKEELLQELSSKLSSGEINQGEIINRLNLNANLLNSTNITDRERLVENKPTPQASSFSVTKMLYALGGAIVVIGIVIFFYQIWDGINSPMRVFITLGLGFIITALGSLLLRNKSEDSIGLVFHFIGGMLIPGGAIVTLNELNFMQTTAWPITITFGIISLFYFLINYVNKNAVLTFFTIANSTAFVYLFVQAIIDNSFYNQEDIIAYLTMAIGLSYLLLAHSFRNGWNKGLVSVLCFFGSASFLAASFSRVFDSTVWQMFYFLIIIGGFYLSIYMRSRAILAMSAIFLIAHLSYITGKYFADSLGWPISLVILGFLFIGLGYASITINKKYIA